MAAVHRGGWLCPPLVLTGRKSFFSCCYLLIPQSLCTPPSPTLVIIEGAESCTSIACPLVLLGPSHPSGVRSIRAGSPGHHGNGVKYHLPYCEGVLVEHPSSGDHSILDPGFSFVWSRYHQSPGSRRAAAEQIGGSIPRAGERENLGLCPVLSPSEWFQAFSGGCFWRLLQLLRGGSQPARNTYGPY